MRDIKISLLRVDTRLLQALYVCTQGSEGWVDGLVIQIVPINIFMELLSYNSKQRNSFRKFIRFYYSFFCRGHPIMLWNWNATIKLLVSVKHDNILLFILTYCRQVSVVRPSSGVSYKIFFLFLKFLVKMAWWWSNDRNLTPVG
jgi:hypothetical protein